MIKNLFKPKYLQQLQKNQFSTLVLGESKDGKVSKSILKVLNAAKQLQEPTDLLISGPGVSQSASKIQESLSSEYVQKLFLVDTDQSTADRLEQIVRKQIDSQNYTQVVTDTSSLGKDLLPRIAVQYNSQPVTDIIGVVEKDVYQRPIYAGNAIATIQSSDAIKFLSFRSTAFEEIPSGSAVSEAQQVEATLDRNEHLATITKEELVKSDRPELSSARFVVSGGRGLKNGENFAILEELGDALGETAIGASRAAVDAGYVSNDLQVGQTGKVVAPELYIAVGISGAIQHVAGMKDSKVIVAINKDEEAPIFDIATYGLVGDLFKVIPELTEKVKAAKN